MDLDQATVENARPLYDLPRDRLVVIAPSREYGRIEASGR
jgi:hypothetical protein